MRLGIGFRLSARPEAGDDSIMDCVQFQERVRNRRAAFDSAFEPLGNYWESDAERGFATRLSEMVTSDNHPLEGWRFFGRWLSAGKSEDLAVIGLPELLRDAAVGVFSHIQAAGFGM